jgi:squalene-associated FAD-dependent desaturase
VTWDLIVVGGGWAGCNAAACASRHGLKTLLLEQGHQFGGRASSFTDPADGALIDNGQHLFLGAYRETRRLLEELGTAPWVEFRSPLAVPYVLAGGRIETLQASPAPGPLGLLLGLLRFQPLSAADKRGLLGLSILGAPGLLPAFVGLLPGFSARMSVGAWLKRCGQSEAAIRLVWEPMVLAACNAKPEQARLREFLAVLGQGFLRGGETAALGRASAPLAQLLSPLPRYLGQQGSEARLSCAVDRAEATEAGWALRLASGEALRSKRLIMALPPRLGARVFGPALSAELGLDAEMARPLSPILSVLLWSPQPLLPGPLQAFGPQADGQQALFHWGFQDKLAQGYRACLVCSAADGLAAQTNEAILGQLPAFLAGRGLPIHYERARVLRERSATPVFSPGSPPRRKQGTARANLALAGDWTETGLPATIEGAVRSGRLAFEAVASGW